MCKFKKALIVIITGIIIFGLTGCSGKTNNKVTANTNPVSSTVQFDGDALSEPNSSIVITDVTGRQLAHFTTNGAGKLAVNVSDYSSGLYFYELQNGDRTLQSGKFVVTH